MAVGPSDGESGMASSAVGVVSTVAVEVHGLGSMFLASVQVGVDFSIVKTAGGESTSAVTGREVR